MNEQHAKGALRRAQEKLNLMTVLVLGLLLSNIINASLSWYAYLHEKRIVTPFNANTSYVTSDSQVDAKYLDLMSMNLLDARFNVSPETIGEQNALLLSYVSSGSYATFLKALNNEAVIVKKEKMSSIFYRQSLHSDPVKLMTVVTGTLNQWVGYRALKSVKKTYILTYRYDGGRITLTTLKEVSHAT